MKTEKIPYIDTLPIKGYPYVFDFPGAEDKIENNSKIWKAKNNFLPSQTASEIMNKFQKQFNIPKTYTNQEKRDVIAVRYEMKLKQFGYMCPYTFASDVSVSVVQKIREQNEWMPGVFVESEPIREFVNGNLAAHILGRVGVIYKEEYDELKVFGYGMNDIIGKDGMEKVLESDIKGKNGTKAVSFFNKGKQKTIVENKPAKFGNYAVLTIDKNLQEIAEKSLETRMQQFSEISGKEIKCGAAVVVDVRNGEILAMATCPNYNPLLFNRDYDILIKDPLKPMLNRALNGLYPPASTFKPITAIAALEEGIITPKDTIFDTGRYMYYAPSYMPYCWNHNGHGKMNVTSAISHSCNYFFYDIGRRTGIQLLNEYSRKFGLGEATGIELPESIGILAGPDYRKKTKSIPWMPGNTIQAAIGQSDNMFTPLQLANYIATLSNGGTRYRLHLLKEIRSYENSEIIKTIEPEILSKIEIKPENHQALMDGLRGVMMDNGTASSLFKNFPVNLGGKTGTAQMAGTPDNGMFVGFGPFEKPEISIVVVFEKGLHGSYAAWTGKDILEAYFIKKQ